MPEPTGGRWLPFASAAFAIGGPRLYCLPPAGSGASMYVPWIARLAAVCDVRPLQPPGRESRLGEPPSADLVELAGDVAERVAELEREPERDAVGYALFGHSMGALLAFEAVRALRRRGAPLPSLLIVSGSRAPQPCGTGQRIAMPKNDEECIDFLRRGGGTPEQLLAHRELMTLVIPALRADLTALAAYRYTDEPPLDVPILAFAARDDAFVPAAAVGEWSACTTAGFALELLDGGHFAVRDAPGALAAITASLRRTAAPGLR